MEMNRLTQNDETAKKIRRMLDIRFTEKYGIWNTWPKEIMRKYEREFDRLYQEETCD
jgi:hypothetical protein